jgi:hypothetical protein
VFTAYAWFLAKGCEKSSQTDLEYYLHHVYYPEVWLTEALYTFLGLTFLAAGTSLCLRFQKHHPAFYREHRCLLWIITFVLSLPLLFRAIFDFSVHFDGESHKMKLAVYNATFFILTDFVPIVSQTFALTFGLIRNRQSQRKREKKEELRQRMSTDFQCRKD